MFSKFFTKNKSCRDEISVESQKQISDFLATYRSDTFPQGLLAIASEHSITCIKNSVVISMTLPFPCDGALHEVAEQLTELLQQTVSFDVDYDVVPVRTHAIKGVKNIIAIASGKGGVGKSTTAVNLAYGLIAEGCHVGILDADIYGPSIPTMLGLQGQKPSSIDGKLLTPLEVNNLAAMSIGFLVEDTKATVWRGPMASRAFSQLLNETDWPDLDYLIVDMPPGTGDVQLTLAQQVPVAGAVVITTPQDIALADAVKGIAMFEQVKLPVLGIIENMSFHQCQQCGHQSHLFGEGGGERIANNENTPLLGQLPLDIRIREDADSGNSVINENSTGELALLYRNIARKVAAQIYYQLDMRSPTTAEIVTNKS
ncbi:ATP-binding protein involved in chromosome partitioning [Colwellia chukchiensis]|uniref:Iron-sulfur cluster carrier protein n=1 Tax=Colwellia chukchiensis TaxID=641665 RepID=A0A1H7QDQ9_9GAMM|nr:iron-sulfur cluster carrier protein ApbC [Colwellia chukchiensis]SEL45898.1 ATP-binding protein involved in chromosome partitioning [Colwellia chukchiensis]